MSQRRFKHVHLQTIQTYSLACYKTLTSLSDVGKTPHEMSQSACRDTLVHKIAINILYSPVYDFM